MKLTSAKTFTDSSGYPKCRLTFEDGPEAVLNPEVFRHLERGFGISLGGPYVDLLPPIVVPPDAEDARGELILEGFTTDAEVVRVATKFRDMLNAHGAWRDGFELA